MASRDGNTNMNNQHNAKYSFYYLLSLAALIFMALSFGMILFSIINKLIPDVLGGYNSGIDSQLKFAISALLISAPIFYFISNLISKGIHKGELEKESAIRRWLTYFIILVSSLIILGVFISIINNFLSGELTGRFIFKSLTVFVIAALSFSFYFYDIKRENPDKPDKVVKIFFFATLILVMAVFVAAWFFVESPQTARNRRLDQVLMQNIYNLENVVNNYYERNKKLPANIDELKADKNIYIGPNTLVDPENNMPLVYNKLNEKEFEICVTFRTSSIAENGKMMTSYVGVGRNNNDHLAGYQCLPGNLYTLKTVEAEMAK